MISPTSKIKQEKVKLYFRNTPFPGPKPGKVSKNYGSVVTSCQEFLESSNKEGSKKTQKKNAAEITSWNHLIFTSKSLWEKGWQMSARLIGLVANLGPQAVG